MGYNLHLLGIDAHYEHGSHMYVVSTNRNDLTLSNVQPKDSFEMRATK